MRRTLRTEWLTLAVVIAMVAGACTMKKQEAPPLTGPSEYGTSIGVEIRPDVLTQDGVTPATITVTARDANGQPKSGQEVRLETIVNNANVDYGTLSQKNVRTGSDGRATATYTAPASGIGASELVITIRATPIGGNANVAVPRSVTVRLVPQGVVLPPSGLSAVFSIFPPEPAEDSTVLVDANASTPIGGISSYSWNFGNGRTASGVTASTTYEEPGSYFITLTIEDSNGRSVSKTSTVTVTVGSSPAADFVFSPAEPRVGQQVIFDGALSTAPAGRRIVGFNWNFGDGEFGTGPAPAKTYRVAGTYNVVLTVTDDAGRSAATSKAVTIVP